MTWPRVAPSPCFRALVPLEELAGVLERRKFAASLASQDLTTSFLTQRYGAATTLVETRAADIIGLYLPPGHAAVLCIDEKTPIQAHDLRDRVLPLSPRRVERHGFEYKRPGTLSLYATLVVQTDEVRGRPRPGTRASTSWASWVKWSRPAPATRRFT